MKATKDIKTGKWMIQYRYTDWQGNRIKSTKRGFNTKREAEEWLREFLLTLQCDFNMLFSDFIEIYMKDAKTRLRLNTYRSKKYIIDDKIIPFFAKKKMNEINAANIRQWQNEMVKKGFSQTYLKTIHNQLSAIFNFAVQFYDLKSNPCRKAGSMGKKHADEMNFWTKEEFELFIDEVMDKQTTYTIFMTFYWTGIRLGELLALTPSDIDFDKKTITISKSYQRINGKDIVTEPKTSKRKRVITAPNFLLDTIKEYMELFYDCDPQDYLFPISKNYIERELKRGVDKSGVKKIRVHDFRHSHASLLIDMNFPILAVSNRLGHENIQTTLNVYGHLYPNKQKQLAERLEEKYMEDLSCKQLAE